MVCSFPYSLPTPARYLCAKHETHRPNRSPGGKAFRRPSRITSQRFWRLPSRLLIPPWPSGLCHSRILGVGTTDSTRETWLGRRARSLELRARAKRDRGKQTRRSRLREEKVDRESRQHIGRNQDPQSSEPSPWKSEKKKAYCQPFETLCRLE